MERFKKGVKAHYKKVLIIFIITTLKGVLVETPATVIQLFTWTVLSVIIAMLGSEFTNIKNFFDEIILLGTKVKEQRIKDFKH